MTIINVNEARFRSNYGKTVKDIENEIAEKIVAACGNGEFKCYVSISTNTSKEVRDRIIDHMVDQGYNIDITDYSTKYKDAPLDQCPYYDEITISW